jgi:hypothetical protein
MYLELSGVARCKCEFVGVDFIRFKKIEGKNVPKVVQSCIKEIIAAGIASASLSANTQSDSGYAAQRLNLPIFLCLTHT